MPLDKSGSKQSFSNNVAAEMHSGKPQPKALAIAYSVKRKGAKPGVKKPKGKVGIKKKSADGEASFS